MGCAGWGEGSPARICIFGMQVRDATSLEPVFYHSMPQELDAELVHSYDVVSLVDLAVGQGNAALTALLSKKPKPYFGITITPEHTSGVKDWLASQVWKAFLTEGSRIFAADLAAIMQESNLDSGDEGGSAGSQKKDGGSAKAKPEPKAKAGGGSGAAVGQKRKGTANASEQSATAPKAKSTTLGKDELMKRSRSSAMGMAMTTKTTRTRRKRKRRRMNE